MRMVMKKNIVILATFSMFLVGQELDADIKQFLLDAGADKPSGQPVIGGDRKNFTRNLKKSQDKRRFLGLRGVRDESKVMSDAKALLQQFEGLSQFALNLANDKNNVTAKEKKELIPILQQIQYQLKVTHDVLS